MANKSVFAAAAGKLIPQTDTINHAGGKAYTLTPRQALAQLACTGTFNATFYADGQQQLDAAQRLAWEAEPEFLAKTAIYAAECGHMKDMPALLLAILSWMEGDAFNRAFGRIVTNGKMLRNFVQIIRSGATGRKSLGSRPKRYVQKWLEEASDIEIMRAAVGNAPSLADVIKMVHPKPVSASREALYGYLIGKPHDVLALPEVVKAFEAFKRDPSLPVPEVPFQMLTALPLTRKHWAQIADKAGWQMLRQSLNTFARNGVFELHGFTKKLADRLADPKEIRRSKVFPYQLLVAFNNLDKAVPEKIRDALEKAMEIALGNVPELNARVTVCPDVSGSMRSPVTGYRKGSTTAVRCIDVAGLVAAALLRRNPHARVLPFENHVVNIDIDAKDSVIANANKLAAIGGGGTCCSAPLEKMAREMQQDQERYPVERKGWPELVVFISDNESWVDGHGKGRGSATMREWRKITAFNPQAKLVCIDIQPYGTTQAANEEGILNIGGFSDQVFDVIKAMMESKGDPDHWVNTIEAVEF